MINPPDSWDSYSMEDPLAKLIHVIYQAYLDQDSVITRAYILYTFMCDTLGDAVKADAIYDELSKIVDLNNLTEKELLFVMGTISENMKRESDG